MTAPCAFLSIGHQYRFKEVNYVQKKIALVLCCIIVLPLCSPAIAVANAVNDGDDHGDITYEGYKEYYR